jgi:hypothetical protein
VHCAPAISHDCSRFSTHNTAKSVVKVRVPAEVSNLCSDSKPSGHEVIELIAGYRSYSFTGPFWPAVRAGRRPGSDNAHYGNLAARGRTAAPFFSCPSPSKTFPSTIVINILFTAATIGRSMPFHSTLPWLRTITPTATGLNEYKEQEQNQSYAGSFHLSTIPGVSLVAMAFFISIETKRSRSTPRLLQYRATASVVAGEAAWRP